MGALFDLAWRESTRAGTSSGSISMEQQSATLTGYLNPAILPPPDSFSEILGKCSPDGTGALRRQLPLAHPECGWLFASSFNYRGLGFNGKRTNASALYEGVPITYWADYKTYEYTIQFTPRPYVLARDSSVPFERMLLNDGYVTARNEYMRFTDAEELPAAEYITAQQGQFEFRVKDGTDPNGHPVPGVIKLLQNKSVVKLRWYQVPEYFITHKLSYMKKALGLINLNDFYGYSKYTLLLMAVTYTRFTPPNPDISPGLSGLAIVSSDKLANVEFIFALFDQKPTKPAPIGDFNDGGHNLFPWFAGGDAKKMGYYYATSKTSGRQLYEPFPMEFLFVDPLVQPQVAP